MNAHDCSSSMIASARGVSARPTHVALRVAFVSTPHMGRVHRTRASVRSVAPLTHVRSYIVSARELNALRSTARGVRIARHSARAFHDSGCRAARLTRTTRSTHRPTLMSRYYCFQPILCRATRVVQLNLGRAASLVSCDHVLDEHLVVIDSLRPSEAHGRGTHDMNVIDTFSHGAHVMRARHVTHARICINYACSVRPLLVEPGMSASVSAAARGTRISRARTRPVRQFVAAKPANLPNGY